MSKFDQQGEEKTSRGPHPDFSSNFVFARNFCRDSEPSWPPGMTVQIDNPLAINPLLWISWTPPLTAQIGKIAHPVSLQSSRNEFTEKVQTVFNTTLKIANEFLAKTSKAVA